MTEDHSSPVNASTPGAKWRAEGKPDPHGDYYDCERAKLAHGTMTDDELANAVFLTNDIGIQTAAKERIRWLSRALEATRINAQCVPDREDIAKAIAYDLENGSAHGARVATTPHLDNYHINGHVNLLALADAVLALTSPKCGDGA